MKIFWSVFFGLFLACFGRADNALPLAIGEQSSFPVEMGTRFSVGNPEVIQVRATQLEGGKSLLLVKGKSQGYSDLVLIGEKGVKRTLAYRVFTKKQAAIARDGQALFTPPAGMRLQSQGDGWVLRGQSRTLADWNAGLALLGQSKGRGTNLAELHPLARLEAEQEIRRRLSRMGLRDVSVMGVGSVVTLVGFADSLQEKELAEILARQVLRDVRSHLVVATERSARLRFRARILEVLRADALSLGLDWGEGAPAGLQVTKALAKASVSLEAGLKFLEKSGGARVLSRPELLLNEKGVAELKVGGEFPVHARSRNTAHVDWKPYGLLLRLELPGVGPRLARAKITVEISALDPTTAQEGVPGLRVSRLETLADLELGRPILLSGLMEKRRSETTQGLPFFGEIPVFGELFRSREFRENQSELAIVLEANP